MSSEIQMPKFGLTMKTGKVSKWLVPEGAAVKKGEELFEVETDKITNKVESPADGILFQILVQAKQVVPVGTVLAILTAAGESVARVEGSASAQNPTGDSDSKPKAAQKAGSQAAPAAPCACSASPAARRLARELGVDMAGIKGSGPGGRILEADVKSYKEALGKIKITPLAAVIARQNGVDLSTVKGTGVNGKIMREDIDRLLHPEKYVEKPKKPSKAQLNAIGTFPMEGMRSVIADNMMASLHDAAQLTLQSEADVTPCVELINDLKALHSREKDFRLSINDVLILATAKALKKHPRMNATFDGQNITRHGDVHMGMAVALTEGLVVPVIRDADKLNLLEIAKVARVMARKARGNELTPDDMHGGTFTITNMNHSVVDVFTPILNPGETGILGAGRVVQKPVVRAGQIVIRSMMGLSLTFDHRIEDGAPAAEFLKTLEEYLAEPTLLIL